ncbi:MAG: hypothetical protein H7068_02785 [Pedobacter sp.]|nr:hypothetical protein [Chitinophagaceae bacterium]
MVVPTKSLTSVYLSSSIHYLSGNQQLIMSNERTISFKNNLDSLMAAIIGAIIIYLLTSLNGIGVSPDSVAYGSVARNMQIGRFWYQFDYMPLIVFPFFFPSFLGSIMFVTRQDVFAFAPVLNTFLFGSIIFFSGCIVQRFKQPNKLYKWLVLSSIVLSSSLLEIYSMLWSETLFILLLLLLIIALNKYSKTYSVKSLVIVGLVTAIACVTRFAGVTFIAIVGLALLMDNNLQWRKKWWHIIFFGLISVSLLLINLIKNYLIQGSLTGNRQKSITSLNQNIRYYSNVIWDWLKLPAGQYTYASILGIGLVVLFTVIIIKKWWQQKDIYSFETIAVIAFVTYTLFIIITATISRYETINNRLMAPAYIPLLFGLTYWLPSFITSVKQKKIGFAIIGLCLIVFAFFQYKQYKWCANWYAIIKADGIPGYNELAWQRSDIINYLHKEKGSFTPKIKIVSNANDAVYFFTGLSCERIPETVHIDGVRNYYKEAPQYIIWFTNDFDSPDILRLGEIEKHRHLDTLKQFKHGLILFSK